MPGHRRCSLKPVDLRGSHLLAKERILASALHDATPARIEGDVPIGEKAQSTPALRAARAAMACACSASAGSHDAAKRADRAEAVDNVVSEE